MKSVRWTFLAGTTLLLASLSWGDALLHVGKIGGLEVESEFYGFEHISGKGEYVYSIGKPIAYRVRLTNHTSVPIPALEVHSTLQSSGVSCAKKDLFPGQNLPGPSRSPMHKAFIAPGEIYEFESIYSISDGLCPSAGHLRIHLQQSGYGKTHTTSLISPAPFRLK